MSNSSSQSNREISEVWAQTIYNPDEKLPLEVPLDLTAGEYYDLACNYTRRHWPMHASESLEKAVAKNKALKQSAEILRNTKLPQAIPSNEAIELNLLARDRMQQWELVRWDDTSEPKFYLDEALALATLCSASFPKFEYGHLTLADLEKSQHNWKEAAEIYKVVLAINKNNVDALLNLGNCYLCLENLDEAQSVFETAMRLDPHNELPKRWLEDIDRRRHSKSEPAESINDIESLRKQYQQLRSFKLPPRGFIDKSGQLVFQVDRLFKPARFSQGFCCSRIVEEAYFLDKEGKNAFARNFRWALDFSDDLAAIFENNLWGFIGLTGDVLIHPQFQDVWPFSDGLAAVQSDELWGFINQIGDWIIPPRFENVLPFTEGRAAVSVDGKIGYIDTGGQIIIEPRYDEADCFSEGLARVVTYETAIRRHLVHYIDLNGNISINFSSILTSLGNGDFAQGYGSISSSQSYRYSGDSLCAGKRETRHTMTTRSRHYSTRGKKHDRLSAGRIRIYVDGKTGFLDRKGNLAIPLQSNGAQAFEEGLAVIIAEPPASADSWSYKDRKVPKFGYMDPQGTQVIPFLYPYARPFSEGLAAVELEDRNVFIDKSANVVIRLSEHAGADDFHDSLAATMTE